MKNILKYYGTGRRKSSVARVFLTVGSGKILINRLTLNKYFNNSILCVYLKQPLYLLGVSDKFDIFVTVNGGGCSGQIGAVCHGISRALIKYDEAVCSSEVVSFDKNLNVGKYREILRLSGFVTRDSRMVERKKVGYRKARKKEQYSKR